MAGNKEITMSLSNILNQTEPMKKMRSRKARVEAESSSVIPSEKGEGKPKELSFEECYEKLCRRRKKAAQKASLLQLAKDEREFKRKRKCLRWFQEDEDDARCDSDEESTEPICYKNMHLAFDPEKSPKFIF